MLRKTIKYTDYNGVEREEDYLFNLSKIVGILNLGSRTPELKALA